MYKKINKIEKKMADEQADEEVYEENFIKVCFLHSVLILIITILIHNIFKNKNFVKKISETTIKENIFPDSKVLKAAAAKLCDEEYPELFEDWTHRKWSIYFDTKILSEVCFFLNFYLKILRKSKI